LFHDCFCLKLYSINLFCSVFNDDIKKDIFKELPLNIMKVYRKLQNFM